MVEDSTGELSQQSLAADSSEDTREQYEAGYAEAQSELEAALRRTGFASMFAASRFSSEAEMSKARTVIAAAGAAFRAYGGKEATLEEVFIQVTGRRLK